jgi:hypothetical protein
MDSFDTAWATFPEWTLGLDERGLAWHRELAVARAPLRRLAGTALPAQAVLPGAGYERLGREEPRKGGRPGRRW